MSPLVGDAAAQSQTSTPDTPAAPGAASADAAPADAVPADAVPADAVPPDADPAASVRYDEGFTLATADDAFELRLGLRSQLRLEVDKPDGREWQARFLIPRLRFALDGHAFGPANTYKFELEVGGGGQIALKDFYVNRILAPNFHLRVGQWKKPFSRHEIVSDFASEFSERALANDFAPTGRDIGLALHNGYERSPEGLEWAVGLFNGTGERGIQQLLCDDPTNIATCSVSPPTNVPGDFGPAFVARVGWNIGPLDGYSEGDLEGGAPRFGLAVSYSANLNRFDKNINGDPVFDHAAEADFMLKIRGFDLQGAIYVVKQGSADPELGFFGQGGLFVLRHRALVAARFSTIPDPFAPSERAVEARAAFDWFFRQHRFKLMTEAGMVHTGSANTTDLQLRTQLQFML